MSESESYDCDPSEAMATMSAALHAPQILFIISRENINASLSHRFHYETNTNSRLIYKTLLIIVRFDFTIVKSQYISRLLFNRLFGRFLFEETILNSSGIASLMICHTQKRRTASDTDLSNHHFSSNSSIAVNLLYKLSMKFTFLPDSHLRRPTEAKRKMSAKHRNSLQINH